MGRVITAWDFYSDYDNWRERREWERADDAEQEELREHHQMESQFVSEPTETTAPLSDCPRCGHELDEDGFCFNCGDDFAHTQAPEAA